MPTVVIFKQCDVSPTFIERLKGNTYELSPGEYGV